MVKKNTIILVLVLLVLGCVAYIIWEHNKPEPPKPKPSAKTEAKSDDNAVTKEDIKETREIGNEVKKTIKQWSK